MQNWAEVTTPKCKHGRHIWETDYPKDLHRLVELEKLKTVAGWGAAKGYKSRDGNQFVVRAMLVLIPPATISHLMRADGTEVMEFQSNMAILNR